VHELRLLKKYAVKEDDRKIAISRRILIGVSMLKIADGIKKYRRIITIVLALIGVGLMLYYDHCDTACSYLKGDILGIDLKWVGIAFMALVIVFAVFKQPSFVRILLAGGLGVEVHLYAFQNT